MTLAGIIPLLPVIQERVSTTRQLGTVRIVASSTFPICPSVGLHVEAREVDTSAPDENVGPIREDLGHVSGSVLKPRAF